jgi:tripartite-type tricarboxylate transporter receptor subunit TctC
MSRLLAVLISLFIPLAAAQDYPSKPVRLVVPFPPGGSTDVVARLLSTRLGESLGQPIVIENRPGAGATLGTESVARAPADGYALVMSSFPSFTTGPLANRSVRYDPVRDFTHVAMIGSFPNGLVVRADSPIRSVADLVAQAKASPGKLHYGSAGFGSAGHLTGELLRHLAGIDIVHVPYKGAAPAFADLLAGQIAFDFDGMINATNQARAGKIRLLAVSSAARLAGQPNLPTIDETVKGVAGESWFGLAAPAGLPAQAARRLQEAAGQALAAPEVRKRLEETGMTLLPMPPGEIVRFIEADIRKWAPIVKLAKLDQGP